MLLLLWAVVRSYNTSFRPASECSLCREEQIQRPEVAYSLREQVQQQGWQVQREPRAGCVQDHRQPQGTTIGSCLTGGKLQGEEQRACQAAIRRGHCDPIVMRFGSEKGCLEDVEHRSWGQSPHGIPAFSQLGFLLDTTPSVTYSHPLT